MLLCCLSAFCFAACGKSGGGKNDKPFTFTIFSDLHYGDHNYNDFECSKGLGKLQRIIDETAESDFYVSLGDTVDMLKNHNTGMFDDVAEVMRDNNLQIFNNEGEQVLQEGKRWIYNLMGNHEAATIEKSALREYVPYVDEVGSVFHFTYNNVLFIGLDANFESVSGKDDCDIMQTARKFTIPPQVMQWLKTAVSENMTDDIDGIIWLSHIAFKDIIHETRWELIEELDQYGKPVTILEGHTHKEAYDKFYDDANPEHVYCEIYTLPATTSSPTYKYYNVMIEDGKIKDIDKHADVYSFE